MLVRAGEVLGELLLGVAAIEDDDPAPDVAEFVPVLEREPDVVDFPFAVD